MIQTLIFTAAELNSKRKKKMPISLPCLERTLNEVAKPPCFFRLESKRSTWRKSKYITISNDAIFLFFLSQCCKAYLNVIRPNRRWKEINYQHEQLDIYCSQWYLFWYLHELFVCHLKLTVHHFRIPFLSSFFTILLKTWITLQWDINSKKWHISLKSKFKRVSFFGRWLSKVWLSIDRINHNFWKLWNQCCAVPRLVVLNDTAKITVPLLS